MTNKVGPILAIGLTWTPLHLASETILFDCQWQISDPNYDVTFLVDSETKIVERSDSKDKLNLLAMNEHGIWLSFPATSSGVVVVQTIERSSVGGNWTDVWLMADGKANPTVGGYCVEKTE